jgi:hypothetical protein
MADLKTVFREQLETDATLTALLTGGVWDASELPVEGLAAGSLPSGVLESDGIRVKPFAAITWRAATPFGADVLGAERQTVEVYVYQQVGYDVIDAVLRRLKGRLHDQPLGASDHEALAWCLWAGDLGEMVAVELGQISMNRSRFEIRKMRA